MKKIVFLLAIASMAFTGFRLVKTKVSDGITISIPSNLNQMSQDDLTSKYPSVRAPLAAYTDQERTADLTINISATQWPDSDTEMAAKFFKSGIYNLYDRVDILSEGVRVIHKKKFIYFEFESRINGSKMALGTQQPIFKYTYIQYYIEANKALVFTFTCSKDKRQKWQPVTREIMQSIKIK